MAIVKEDVSGGYDVSFVDSLEKDYECPICLLAVRDPVQTPCGHSFCKTCFDQVAERQGRGREVECPLDKEKLATSEVFNDMKVRRKVLSLKVKCTNKSSDSAEVCEWIRELNYLQDHHNECRFEIVGCPKDCGNIMQRCDVTNHTIFTCPRRLVTCGSCNMEVEMRDMEQHNSFCPKFSINCMLGCGKKVERIDMEDHVSELGDCPNTIMHCIFNDVGCDVMVKRHEMEQHLTTAVVQHQIKQHQTVKALRDDNKTLRDENKTLRDDNKTMKDENKTLRDENKTLRDENKTLRDDNKTLRDENKQIKESLHFVNSALIQLFASPNENIVSCCGRAIVLFTVFHGEVTHKTSKHFFAHLNGYKVTLKIWPENGDLCAALVPVYGNRDRELRWPFRLRHTITLAGRRHQEDDIKMTIDPVTLDEDLVAYCFHSPNRSYFPNESLNYRRCTTASLYVPRSVLFTRKYVKNEEIVIVVEVDN